MQILEIVAITFSSKLFLPSSEYFCQEKSIDLSFLDCNSGTMFGWNHNGDMAPQKLTWFEIGYFPNTFLK